jgi:ABC-type nitrate/sulfonate/bicarbonate transport system substrate-binding protein
MKRANRAAALTVAALAFVLACAPTPFAPTPPAPAPTRAVAAGSAATPRSGPRTTITVINTAPTGAYGGFWTAIEAGYFADEALEVQIADIGSTSRAIPALLAGEAQFSTLDGQTVIQADAQGADIRLVLSITNHLVFSVMVSDDVPNPQALKGKKLGITRAGSAVDTAARQALKIFKLQPETDVALIPLDSGPNVLVGMAAHQIDGGVLGPPTNLRAKDQGFHELLNLAKEGPEFPSIAIGSSHAYATDHPDVMLGFARAYSRGVVRFKADRELAMKAYQKYLKIDDLRVLGDTWDQYRPYLDIPPVVTAAALQNAIEAAAVDVPQAKGTSPEKYFDGSWIQQLDQAGFFKNLTTGEWHPW